jgi:hypothetical protein
MGTFLSLFEARNKKRKQQKISETVARKRYE